MKLIAARTMGKVVVYLVLTIGAALCFLPVFWLARSSVMTLGDIFRPRSSGLPASAGKTSRKRCRRARSSCISGTP